MNIPTTLQEVLDELLGVTRRGKPRRVWDNMTPQRYGHLIELLDKGVAPALCFEAAQRINTSAWLKKPVAEVTEEDVKKLLAEKPWDAPSKEEPLG